MNEEQVKKYRQKVRDHVQKEQWVSQMNNTKWEELRLAMYAMPTPPCYRMKCVFQSEDERDIDKLIHDDISNAIGIWNDENFIHTFDIEWVKIAKLRKEPRGRLIPPEILDYSTQIRAVLEQFNIPYEEQERLFTIYGYKRIQK